VIPKVPEQNVTHGIDQVANPEMPSSGEANHDNLNT